MAHDAVSPSVHGHGRRGSMHPPGTTCISACRHRQKARAEWHEFGGMIRAHAWHVSWCMSPWRATALQRPNLMRAPCLHSVSTPATAHIRLRPATHTPGEQLCIGVLEEASYVSTTEGQASQAQGQQHGHTHLQARQPGCTHTMLLRQGTWHCDHQTARCPVAAHLLK